MWTEDQDAALVQLWQAGHSASVIASKFEGKTRSAIIGRITRIRAAGGRDLRQDYPTVHMSGGAQTPTGERKPRIRQPVRSRNPLDGEYEPEPVTLAGPKLRPFLALVEPPAVVLKANEVEPNGTPVGLMDLCSAACKWPVTESAPHKFCNKVRRGDGPYCDEHTVKSRATPKRVSEMQRGKHEVPFQ